MWQRIEFNPYRPQNFREIGRQIERQIFFISHTTVTVKEGQGHQNWYQNVELSSLHHHTMFERNQCVNVWTKANIKFLSRQNCKIKTKGKFVLILQFYLPQFREEWEITWDFKDCNICTNLHTL